jgi:hypothetical protein
MQVKRAQIVTSVARTRLASITTAARRFARSATAPLDGAADTSVNVVIGGFLGNAWDLWMAEGL